MNVKQSLEAAGHERAEPSREEAIALTESVLMLLRQQITEEAIQRYRGIELTGVQWRISLSVLDPEDMALRGGAEADLVLDALQLAEID